MTTPLGDKIKAMIETSGPLPVSTYFTLCLADPEHGYYLHRDPLGRNGDFTTAPEVSQLFGELIGIFLVQAWQRQGSPSKTVLIEGGPGRGTMMADILNVIGQVAPGLYNSLSVQLLETSPQLRAHQAKTLRRHKTKIGWIDAIDDAPAGFTLFVANELLDAIATRQFVKTKDGFCERVVTLDDQGALTFGVSPTALDFETLPASWKTQPEGSIFEPAPAREALMAEICERLKTNGGTALIIDYGHLKSDFGDTLQAVRKHRFDPPLENPGEADLTSHVDFAALASVAYHEGVHVHPMMMQGAFLADLGLGARASQLGRGKNAATQQQIVTDARRLAGDGADEMGNLFKVLCISHQPVTLFPFNAED